MTSSPLLIVSVEPCCSLASLIVVCRACCPWWACCLLRRGYRDVDEALLDDGGSGGGVVLIVHDRVHCWAKGLLSTWWRAKEVGEAWRTRRASLIAWLLSGPLVSFVTLCPTLYRAPARLSRVWRQRQGFDDLRRERETLGVYIGIVYRGATSSSTTTSRPAWCRAG